MIAAVDPALAGLVGTALGAGIAGAIGYFLSEKGRDHEVVMRSLVEAHERRVRIDADRERASRVISRYANTALRWAGALGANYESPHPYTLLDFDEILYEAKVVLGDPDGVVDELHRAVIALAAAIDEKGVTLEPAPPFGAPFNHDASFPLFREVVKVRDLAVKTQNWLIDEGRKRYD